MAIILSGSDFNVIVSFLFSPRGLLSRGDSVSKYKFLKLSDDETLKLLFMTIVVYFDLGFNF